MQVLFSDNEGAKSLCLDVFSWDENDISRKFQGCRTPEGFVATFEQNFGTPSAGKAASQSDSPPSSSVNSQTGSKRPKAPPNLIPATKKARTEHTQKDDGFEAESMDRAIYDHFKGEYYTQSVRIDF